MRRLSVLLISVLLALVLPFAGVWFADSIVRPGASFAWPAFLIYALIILAVAAPFVMRVASTKAPAKRKPSESFPAWGWAGVGLTVVAWVFAWTRFDWFAPLQLYTFTPLWLGYIIVINALTFRRTGHCLLTDRPRCFLRLFPVSAAFWWYFEYINRYVGNWRYTGVESIGALEYFIHASIAFSTVLPAVVGTRDWLASFPRLSAGLTRAWPVSFATSKPVAWALLLLGASAFYGIGARPEQLYSMVWVAPLLVVVALQVLLRQPNVLNDLARGDWSNAWLAAVAALVCGFFWEMWNWQSLARWEYAIPLAHRFLIFEMPLLGYAGYLPFGVFCVVVSNLVWDYRPSKRS